MPQKTKYILAAVLLISFIMGWAVGAFFPKMVVAFFNKDKDIVLDDGTKIDRDDRMTILMMGVDARPGEKNTRTDTMILAIIDKPNEVVSFLSIPRDTRVKIPGQGYDKINSANLYGGAELAKETVENLVGIPIDHYVRTNFEGFKAIIDTLGGVNIDVEKNMYYRASDVFINLKKGLQRLDGEKALQYARFRRDNLGDIGRTQRQQKVMLAIAKEALQAKNIVKLPKLIPQMKEAVETDISLTDMLALAKMGNKLNPETIATQTLPGNFLNYKGISYWHVDEEQAREVVMAMLKGKDGTPVINTALSGQIRELEGANKPKVQAPPVDTEPALNQENNTGSGTTGNVYPEPQEGQPGDSGQQDPQDETNPELPSGTEPGGGTVVGDTYGNSGNTAESTPNSGI